MLSWVAPVSILRSCCRIIWGKRMWWESTVPPPPRQPTLVASQLCCLPYKSNTNTKHMLVNIQNTVSVYFHRFLYSFPKMLQFLVTKILIWCMEILSVFVCVHNIVVCRIPSPIFLPMQMLQNIVPPKIQPPQKLSLV